MEIIRYRVIDSTNSAAHGLAEAGRPEWTVVVAESQTNGRGRHGKSWISPTGGLTFSVILRPNLSIDLLPITQFYASNAVRTALARATQSRLFTKWPNDLILGGKKVGGILVETKSSGGKGSFSIVGVGVNIRVQTSALPEEAASIYPASNMTAPPEGVLELILQQMVSDYESLNQPKEILNVWWADCLHKNQKVQVETTEGVIVGTNVGLDDSGRLLLAAGDGTMRVVAEGSLRLFPQV